MNFKYFNQDGNISTFKMDKNYKLKLVLNMMPELDLDKFSTAVEMGILKSTLDGTLKENKDYLKFITILGLIHDGLMWFE